MPPMSVAQSVWMIHATLSGPNQLSSLAVGRIGG